jgi:TldD protein
MKRVFAVAACLLGFIALARPAFAQKPGSTPVMQALEQEIKRAFDLLKEKGNPAPYFISYSVKENDGVEIEASRGALRNSQRSQSRLLDIDLRVGDYVFDNTHQIRGQRGASGAQAFSYPVLMPVDNDVDALRSVIWLETDRKYKAAVERFIQVKANRTIKVEEEDTSADMSRQAVETAKLPMAALDLNVANWEKKLKAFSALFNKFPEIYEGTVSLSSNADNDYLANSEGTAISHGRNSWRLGIYARTKADDGMELYRFEAFDSHTSDRLNSD